MPSLFYTIRFRILALSSLVALGVFLSVYFFVPPESRVLKLTDIYALLAASLLFLTLFITPLYQFFPGLPYKRPVILARRALGVSTFLFALLHGTYAFFYQLDGFQGLGFLSQKYLIAISLSFTAFIILSLLSLTSFDSAIRHLGFKRWKILHRFIYLAAILVAIHALMLGTQFSNLNSPYFWVAFVLVACLVFLQALRIDRSLEKKAFRSPNLGFFSAAAVCLITVGLVISQSPTSSGSSLLNIHAQHLQLAQQAQQQSAPNPTNYAGLRGDPTKRYSVSFLHPDIALANQDISLQFKVNDASSGEPVFLFDKVYEKTIHLIIVDDQLHYFSHIHPIQQADGFTITTQLPKDGFYHLYLDFQPFGAIEQQFAFTLQVGNPSPVTPSLTPPDTNFSKSFGNYQITLQAPNPLIASQLSLGNQTLSFILKDSKTGKPITNLEPYLGAFGHLVMINEQTFDYIHVHPTLAITPAPDSRGGPQVDFLPLGLYGPIKPGTYRLFAQFNPAGQLIVADYTVTIH